jgi:hypothetical protein
VIIRLNQDNDRPWGERDELGVVLRRIADLVRTRLGRPKASTLCLRIEAHSRKLSDGGPRQQAGLHPPFGFAGLP